VRTTEQVPGQNKTVWRRSLRWTGLGLLLLGSGLGVHLAQQHLLDPKEFPIRQVRLEGHLQHLKSAHIKEALQAYVGENFFVLNIDALHTTLAANPWVAHVRVWRQWPDTLKVRLQERIAFGYWNEDELIDIHGERFQPSVIKQTSGLPRLSGPKGYELTVMQTYKQANARLKKIDLQLTELTLDERFAWRMRLHNGVKLKLGKEHFSERFARFLAVYSKVLAGRIHHIETIDLRYINGFAVRWKRKSTVTQLSPVHRVLQRKNLQRTSTTMPKKHFNGNSHSYRTYAKRTCVARERSVDGPEGRRQAHRDVFTASSGTSCVSPVLYGHRQGVWHPIYGD
jgi:cell division protein FtsQ